MVRHLCHRSRAEALTFDVSKGFMISPGNLPLKPAQNEKKTNEANKSTILQQERGHPLPHKPPKAKGECTSGR